MTHEPRSTRRSGSAAIEFAIWLPVLLMFVSTVVDYGFYMTQRVAISRATMEGARAGAALFEPPDSAPGTLVQAAALARTKLVLDELDISCSAPSCAVNTDYCPAGDAGCLDFASPPFDAIVVETSKSFTPLFGLIPTPARIDEKLIMATEHQR